jgi:hypothetical protein
MIDIDMAEKNQGFAVLQEVDAPTFTRFVHWLYVGWYDHPRTAFQRRSTSPFQPIPTRVKEAPQPAADDSWDVWGSTSTKKEKKKRRSERDTLKVQVREALKADFVETSYKTPLTHPYHAAPARHNQETSEDYTEVFLCHVRMYVFAEKYDIEPLMIYAKKSLHETLAVFNLYQDRIPDVLALVRYVLENTTSRPGDQDNLRSVVARYIVTELKQLGLQPEFKELLRSDEGSFLDDFLSTLVEKVS